MAVDGPSNSNRHTNPIKDEGLFRTAENGGVSLFKTLSEEQLLKALSLLSEDGRSLLHVAVSFAVLRSPPPPNSSEPTISGLNNVDEEGWAPLHSAASSGNAEIVETLLSRA